MSVSSRRLRVCYFNRSYWPDTGATGQLLTELAEDLAGRHGFEVTVVAGPSLTGESRPRRETRNGVTIRRTWSTRFAARRFAGRVANYMTYFVASVMMAMRLPRQDVVVALTDPPIIGLAALTAARRGGRFVFYCQDIFPEVGALVQGFRSRVVDRVLDAINRLLLQRADRVIALGEVMAERLRTAKGASGDRLAVIHNWADAGAIVPGEKRNAFSETHGLVGRFVVLHAGNIGLGQNLDFVLSAAAELRHDPRILFLFIGDGTRREGLSRMAEQRGLGNVRFLPFQPREDMRFTYASADVCLVSLREGLSGFIVPSKIYPVLAAGRPTIAAVDAESEAAELIARHDCGIRIAPGDADGLVAAIQRLAADAPLRDAMGQAARHASELFDRRRQVDAHARLLLEVTSAR